MQTTPSLFPGINRLGLVLSGGGSRSAYQIGVLRAFERTFGQDANRFSVVVGSSLGSINGLLFAAGLKHGIGQALDVLEKLWLERTFRNTFAGSPSRSFIKAVRVAMLRYHMPGPDATEMAIFNPEPLRIAIDNALSDFGSLHPDRRAPFLEAVAIMATIEGDTRKPLLIASTKHAIDARMLNGAAFSVTYVDELTAKHGLASAALPSVLPPVDLSLRSKQVKLVDGGICDNVPVDPAMRLGAEALIVIDSSGRRWWFTHHNKAFDTRPTWEVPAPESTFCIRPMGMAECINQQALGQLLKAAVGRSSKDFIQSLGATWPIFKILKHKMGEDFAYEIMSYVALHPEYARALIENGYNEGMAVFKSFIKA